MDSFDSHFNNVLLGGNGGGYNELTYEAQRAIYESQKKYSEQYESSEVESADAPEEEGEEEEENDDNNNGDDDEHGDADSWIMESDTDGTMSTTESEPDSPRSPSPEPARIYLGPEWINYDQVPHAQNRMPQMPFPQMPLPQMPQMPVIYVFIPVPYYQQ